MYGSSLGADTNAAKVTCSGSTGAAHAHKTAQYVENSRNTLPLGKEMDLEETADSESFY